MWSILKNITLVALAIAGFIFLSPGFVFAFIFIYIGITSFIRFNKKNTYINLQANLPTSKIRSMAMGQVEVKGKLLMTNPMLSKIGNKDCIGYRYVIQDVETDSDGKVSYTTISDEIQCNDFAIEDDTGKVTVKAKDIDFKWLKEDHSHYVYDKQHTQYLLQEGDEVLIIAHAKSSANETYLHKATDDSVFTLAPFSSVSLWNKSKPLLNSLLFFGALFFIVVAFILFLEVELTESHILFRFPTSFEPFNLNQFLH